MMAMSDQPQWNVVFYQDARGRKPVDDWISELAEREQARIFKTIELLEKYGVRLTMPHCRQVRGKIWELRIAAGRRDYRILYAAAPGRQFVLLHGFSKKTDKTPPGDWAMAEVRFADYLTRTKGESER
jgi:phage-related protein